MCLNEGYESSFDLIISNQPYSNHHCFFPPWAGLLRSLVSGGTVKIAGLSCCFLGWGDYPG